MSGTDPSSTERDQAHESIVEWDSQARILCANESFGRLIGCDPALVAGQPLSRWLNEASLQSIRNGSLIHRTTPGFFELDLGGRFCLASVTYSALGSAPDISGTAFICPLDALPHPVNDLHWLMRRYEALLASTREILAITNEERVVQYVSPGVFEALGYRPEELIGRKADMLFPPAELPRAIEERAGLIEEPGRRRFLKRRFVTKSGEVRDFEGHVVSSPGHPYLHAVVSSFTDVTDKERMVRKAQEAARLEGVGRLAGGIAHDFNNVLTVIQGQVELMQARNTDARQARGLAEIQGAADRATALISQLLAFARRSVATPKSLDLAAMIAGLEGRLKGELPAGVTLTVSTQAGLPPILADPILVEEVLKALFANAQEATPRGGTISLTASLWSEDSAQPRPQDLKPGAYVVMLVADTGSGMDRATLQHAFEPFFTTKSSAKSTGMSLASCYGIMKQSGGHIDIESEAGKGTTVTLFWPVAVTEASAGQGAEPDPGEQPLGNGELVLLVDDEPQVLEAVAEALRTVGYRVEPMGGPEEALAWIEAGGQPALLVTDLVMPGMEGDELAGRIHARHRALPVLYISGFAATATVKNTWLRNGFNFLPKPFSQQALARAVRRLLLNEGR